MRAIQTVVDRAFPVHWLLFIFRADYAGGDIQATAEGELRWIPLLELDRYERPYTDLQHWSHIINETPGIWQGKVPYDTPVQLVGEVIYD